MSETAKQNRSCSGLVGHRHVNYKDSKRCVQCNHLCPRILSSIPSFQVRYASPSCATFRIHVRRRFLVTDSLIMLFFLCFPNVKPLYITTQYKRISCLKIKKSTLTLTFYHFSVRIFRLHIWKYWKPLNKI